MHQSQLHSIDELKKHLLDVGHIQNPADVLSPSDLLMVHTMCSSHDAVDEWHMHIQACVWSKGRYFEQLL